MQQRINGEVVSYAPMQVFHAGSASYVGYGHSAGDGWSVQYSYRCPCGETHKIHALNVWPTGDHKADTVEHVCPTTREANSVELVRPT